MVADSLDGVWNNSPSIGAGLGVGLLLGILSSGSGSTEYVERVNTSPSTENFKFGYVFSKVKKVRVEGYKPEYPGEDAQHARSLLRRHLSRWQPKPPWISVLPVSARFG